MNTQVATTLGKAAPARRAQLAGSVRQFVTNDAFCNTLQNWDVNNVDPRRQREPTNLLFITQQLAAFNSVPGLAQQVRAWLAAP